MCLLVSSDGKGGAHICKEPPPVKSRVPSIFQDSVWI